MSDFTQPFSPDNEIEIKRLESALDAASVGTWEYNLKNNQFRLCKRFRSIFDYPFDFITSFDAVLSRVNSDDVESIRQQVGSILEQKSSDQFEIEFRTLGGEGEKVRWITCKGQAHFDEKENAYLLSGMIIDITKNVLSRQELSTSEERFRSLIEEAPIATCMFVGREMRIEIANETMIGYWGKDRSVIGKTLKEAVPELIGQPFIDILNTVYTTGKTYTATNMPAKLKVNGVLSEFYYDFTYKPLRNSDGEIYAVMDTAVDVTDKMLSQKALEESESKLRSVVATAPAAIGLFVGRDLVIEMPNQAFIDIVGKGPNVVGKPLREVMPELESQAYLQILDDVYTSGKMYQSFGTQVDIVRNGVMTNNFYNITYTPLLDADGNVYAILDIAIDVTERMEEQRQVENSQMQLLTLFEQSPVGIAILDKTDLVFTMANTFYGELVGRKPDELIGKSLFDAIPELKGQGFEKMLREVIATGKPLISKELAVDLLRDGEKETIYIDFTYQPKRELDNTISGILVVVIDITQQVLARQKIQETETSLRGAVELANLGTWHIDLNTRILDYSSRLRKWFGIGEDEIITVERGYEPIREADHPLIKSAFLHAISPGTDGIYDVEYVVEASKAGRQRILHAQGKTYYNEKGEPVKVSGSVHDVTEQRQIQLALEQIVQERTEELETANEELGAINEEYLATNDELAKANELLVRSNENLQQFAYIASHDLQEPLRKIQSFGDLLRNKFSSDLGEGAYYLQRMQAAAKRMSALIEDLLSFSRVSVFQDNTEPVALNKIIKSVLNDLELVIHETNATINISELPVIQGDKLQLGQLFQNLVSNALKFTRSGINPVIDITCEKLNVSDLPPHIKPVRFSQYYYALKVADNGIGFDDKYTDRIFQIFQRLHGKTEYAGTGIGLAICEKVATNHGGAISASSVMGQGSVFSVYFPISI